VRRFILLTVTLFLLCTASIGTAILIGRQQPLPERIRALHLTDCAPPCWIGIVPGKTTMHEAQEIVNEIFKKSPYTLVWDTTFSPNLTFHLFQPPNSIKILIVHINKDLLNENVGWIDISPETSDHNDRLPTIADLIALWGSPTCVDTVNYNLNYNGELGQNIVSLNIIMPLNFMPSNYEKDTGIGSISLGDPLPRSKVCDWTAFRKDYLLKTWHGFSSRHYYLP